MEPVISRRCPSSGLQRLREIRDSSRIISVRPAEISLLSRSLTATRRARLSCPDAAPAAREQTVSSRSRGSMALPPAIRHLKPVSPASLPARLCRRPGSSGGGEKPEVCRTGTACRLARASACCLLLRILPEDAI